MQRGLTHKNWIRLKDMLVVLLVAAGSALFLKAFVVDAIVVPSHSMEQTLLAGDFVLVNKLIYGTRVGNAAAHASFPSFRVPGIRNIERGDVVVFQLPSVTEPLYYVKRCIGTPGDAVSMENGTILVNGTPLTARGTTKLNESFGPVHVPRAGDVLPLEPAKSSRWESLLRLEGHRLTDDQTLGVQIDGISAHEYTVKQDYLFVLGDNLDHSDDSRSWGFLPKDNVIGEAMMVYWSDDGGNGIRWDRIGRSVR